MHTDQKQFINSTVDIINQVAVKLIEATSQNAKKNALKNFIGINNENLEKTIVFLSHFFPESIYLDKYRAVKDQLQIMLIQRFILFIVQEDLRSKDFRNNLMNFKDELLSDLSENVYVKESL